MRFIIFVIDNQPNGSASGNEIEAIDAFNDSLQKNGQWITAAGINPSTKATLIDNRAGLNQDRKSTRLNSSHIPLYRMPSSA